MEIIEDVAQKCDKHKKKNLYWTKNGIKVVRYPLPCGDYIQVTDKVADVIKRKTERGISIKKMDFLGTYTVAVDTKYGIQELVTDICGKQHDRFRDECILAQNNGIRLYILVENDGEYVDKKKAVYNKPIKGLSDLHSWVNPRLFIWYKGKQKFPNATKGITLQKACYTMEKKYGVQFVFCSSADAGRIVVELLERG